MLQDFLRHPRSVCGRALAETRGGMLQDFLLDEGWMKAG
jgi:hypothetical protein